MNAPLQSIRDSLGPNRVWRFIVASATKNYEACFRWQWGLISSLLLQSAVHGATASYTPHKLFERRLDDHLECEHGPSSGDVNPLGDTSSPSLQFAPCDDDWSVRGARFRVGHFSLQLFLYTSENLTMVAKHLPTGVRLRHDNLSLMT